MLYFCVLEFDILELFFNFFCFFFLTRIVGKARKKVKYVPYRLTATRAGCILKTTFVRPD